MATRQYGNICICLENLHLPTESIETCFETCLRNIYLPNNLAPNCLLFLQPVRHTAKQNYNPRNMYERSSLRYAHTTGYTSLLYTNSSEFILTCGSDGDIRKWRGIDDDDPSSNCLGEFVICLEQKEDKLLASTDRNTVQTYTFPDMDIDGTLMRFTAPVICIKVKAGYVVAGSEDTTIKALKEGESQPIEVTGHKGPVLALDVHPKGSYVASASGDGDIKIWNLLDCGKEIKTICGLPKINSFENAKYFGTPCFEPQNGNYLAYVSNKDVFVLNTSRWEIEFCLTDDKIKSKYTCCQFSEDGLLIAAATDKGEISVFDFSTRQTIQCEAPSSECRAITNLAWNPKTNKELAYCDASGQLGTLFLTGAKQIGYDMMADANAMVNDYGDIEFADDEAMVGDADENDEDAVSIEKLKNKVMTYINGDAQDDDTKDSLDIESIAPSTDYLGPELKKGLKQQAAFQPSSTPNHLEHRYLVWNSVGIVTIHSDGADGSIDAEFHDASVHHSLHISNYNNHNMASLSSSVLAMAADNSSKLVCIALAASGNKEWSVQLPDCESVDAICATSKLVAVATSMQFLRIFTVMGTQREILSLPGPVVCISGYEDRIMICYHSAPSSERQQHIEAMLLQMSGLRLKCQNIKVPLTPERRLIWLGFSDCGSPVFSDSMGLVQLFSLKSNCWYPVCDTMKQSSSVSNNYFVISLSERSQILQAVLCRGTSYPMTTPRPMMQELPLQMPLCDMESEKAAMEDSMLRSYIMSADNADKTLKETAIKLFALACRCEMEMRAKELIETIACPDLLMLAVKYANKLGRIHLADRLTELLPQVEEVQQSKEHEEQLVDQSLPASTLILLKAAQNSSMLSNKLAPKTMDFGSAKKSTLKRLSASNSSTPSLFKKFTNDYQAPVPEISQENISGIETDTQLSKTIEHTEKTSMSRTPLNSVNPFASKRKISEVDKTILMGSEKLKMAKKI